MCLLNSWQRLVRNRKSRKRCLELSLGIFLALLWIVAVSAVVCLFLIYTEFKSDLLDKQQQDDDDECEDCPLFAICDEVANGTYNATALPSPIVICEGGPTPLKTHVFGGDVLNTTKAEGTWVRIRGVMVINAMIEFQATFDGSGSSTGYITLITPIPVSTVHHRGSGTVEVVSGTGFWLCPAQVVSEGSFMATTYRCDQTAIASQTKTLVMSFTVMLQA